MVMTGADDEQPRRVNYTELLALIRRAANLFAHLGGKRPVDVVARGEQAGAHTVNNHLGIARPHAGLLVLN